MDGWSRLIQTARGQSSYHSLSAGICEYVGELVRIKYADLVPTLATEPLPEKHATQVGREMLRRLNGRGRALAVPEAVQDVPPAPTPTQERSWNGPAIVGPDRRCNPAGSCSFPSY
jgi:hypothetical protein